MFGMVEHFPEFSFSMGTEWVTCEVKGHGRFVSTLDMYVEQMNRPHDYLLDDVMKAYEGEPVFKWVDLLTLPHFALACVISGFERHQEEKEADKWSDARVPGVNISPR